MELMRRSFNLIYAFVITLVISSAAMLEVENSHIDDPDEKYVFHDMLYFTIVTMTTVGYGDISPKSDEGRAIVVFTIVIILSVLPKRF